MAPPSTKPNIALLVSDDLLSYSLAAYGGRRPVMPNLDDLSRSPVAVALRGYSASSICVPSRVSLLTGRYASRLWAHYRPRKAMVSLIDFAPSHFGSGATLPSVLASAGYRTAFVGKWHTGQSCQGGSEATRSFCQDKTRRIRNTCGYFNSGVYLNQSCMSQFVQREGGFHVAYEIYHDNEVIAQRGHHPEATVEAARAFVQRARSARNQFFLWVAFTHAHEPEDHLRRLQNRSTLASTVDPTSPPPPATLMAAWRRQRAALLRRLADIGATCGDFECAGVPSPQIGAAWLDASLPPLIEELQKGPGALIIFTSDHGEHPCPEPWMRRPYRVARPTRREWKTWQGQPLPGRGGRPHAPSLGKAPGLYHQLAPHSPRLASNIGVASWRRSAFCS